MLKLLPILLCSASLLPLQAQFDLIALHGKVWTENPQQPEAEAFAVAGNRILAVGTDAEIQNLASPHTVVIDLHGRRVVPGFNDAHVHMFWGGKSIASVQLRDVTSRQQFQQLIADYAQTHLAGEWILDGNWDEEKWTPAELPTHEWIDAVTPNNPV